MMKRLLSLLLAASLSLALVACGNTSTPSGSGSAAPAGGSFSPGRRSGRPAFLIFDL